MKFTNY